jgi:hypothetical protein
MDTTASAVNDAPTSTDVAPPATFAEAFAADASPASDTPAQTTDAAAAEQPTTAQEDSSQQSDDRSPFIPRQRFDEVNGKLNELKTWKEQRAWAEAVDQQTFAQMAQWYQQAHADPLAFATNLIAELQQHETYGPQLKSLAARTLAQRQAPAGPDLEGVVIDLGNGQSIPLSALREQWMAQVRKEFEPIAQTVQQVNSDRQAAEAKSFATTSLTELRQLPGFKDHEPAIKAELGKMKLPADAGPDLVLLAAQAAYARVVPAKLQQSTTQSAQSQLLDNLQRKAAGNSVNPSSAAPSTPRRIDSFHQLGPDAWK